jgi:hypothetical protein
MQFYSFKIKTNGVSRSHANKISPVPYREGVDLHSHTHLPFFVGSTNGDNPEKYRNKL